MGLLFFIFDLADYSGCMALNLLGWENGTKYLNLFVL